MLDRLRQGPCSCLVFTWCQPHSISAVRLAAELWGNPKGRAVSYRKTERILSSSGDSIPTSIFGSFLLEGGVGDSPSQALSADRWSVHYTNPSSPHMWGYDSQALVEALSENLGFLRRNHRPSHVMVCPIKAKGRAANIC